MQTFSEIINFLTAVIFFVGTALSVWKVFKKRSAKQIKSINDKIMNETIVKDEKDVINKVSEKSSPAILISAFVIFFINLIYVLTNNSTWLGNTGNFVITCITAFCITIIYNETVLKK